MPIITTTILSTFLTACLLKVGEKVSEKTIENVFEHKKEILERFTGLFKQEISTLGLSDTATLEEVQKQLEAKPEVARQALEKLNNNPKLLADLNEELEQMSGMTINAKNIAAAGNVSINNQTNKFS